jgi:hypothetical protein
MVHSPGEIWRQVPGSRHFGDWEVRFRDTWNVALVLDPHRDMTAAPAERLGPASPPFGIRSTSPGRPPEAVPLRVQIPARRLPDWRIESGSASPPPRSPVTSSRPTRRVSLVPYGCARTRIAEFPWCLADESGPIGS